MEPEGSSPCSQQPTTYWIGSYRRFGSGFRRDVDKIFAFGGCYTAYIGSYRRFGSSFRRDVDKIFAFGDVTRRRLEVTDVSGQSMGPIFKSHAVF
jgi:hypothetical protein